MSRTKCPYPCWILVLTTLFLLAAAPLAAGESRWYLNGKIGQASLETQFGTRSPKFFDDSDETGSVEVGYVLHRYLAVQAGYHDLGTYQGFGSPCPEDAEVCPATLAVANDPSLALCIEGATDPICRSALVAVPMTADVTGLSLSLVPRWPIGERFSLYGKLGVIDWDSDVDGAGFGRIDRYSDRDLLTGVGAQYVFPKGIGVLVEYQRLDFDHDSTSLGASWRF